MAKAFIYTISLIFLTLTSHAEEAPTALTKEQCETSVENTLRSIKKHKLSLRKQTARSLSNIEKNIIRTLLADLKSKVSVESCLTAEDEVLTGYQCMLDNTDIQDCRLDKPKDDS